MPTFLTEKDGFEGPKIEADAFWHAEHLAKEIDLNLEVVGEHILTIKRLGFSEADADKMCKAFSEEEKIE